MKQYKAKESKTIWLILIGLAVINLFFFEHRIQYFPYLFFILVVLALFINYEFIINKEKRTLTLHIKIFNWKLISRTSTPETIREAYFIKLGEKESALLRVNGQVRWKLANFSPGDYLNELNQFVQEENIPIKKIGYKG